MRKAVIIALVGLLSGAGLWYAQVSRRVTTTTADTVTGSLAVTIDGVSAERTIAGNLNINGASLEANQTVMLQGAFADAVTGNLAVSIGGASAKPTITGNLNLNGATLLANQTAMLQGAFAVEGILEARSLPDGELVLEGDVRMSPAKP